MGVRIKKFTFVLSMMALSLANAKAQSKQDRKTISYLNAFTRHVSKHVHTEKPYACIHTRNLANTHLSLWQEWSKTHRWPSAVRNLSETKASKASATSVVRISWYLYDDSAHEIEVNNNGRWTLFGARYDMGFETGSFYFKPAQMQTLQKLLKSLPRSQKVLRWSDVLFISGRRNGRWIIRLYSRSHKPKAVSRLLQMMAPKSRMTGFQLAELP